MVFEEYFDGDAVDETVDVWLMRGEELLVTEAVDVLDNNEDLDEVIVLNVENDDELETDTLSDDDPESELVLVKNLFDSELQGLADELDECEGDEEDERVPDELPGEDGLLFAVWVLVDTSDADTLDVPEWVE